MLKQKLALDYYSSILAQIFTIIAGIIVAKVAGPGVLGVLAFGLSFASMFGVISGFGLGAAHVKLISSGEDLAKCNATFTVMKFISTAVFLFVIFAVLLSQRYLFNLNFESETHRNVTMIFILIATASSLARIPLSTFTAKMEIAKKNIPLLLEQAGTSIAKIILALLGFGALAISLSNLVVAVLICILSFYLFKRYPFSKFDRALAKKYLKIAFPVAGIIMVSTVVMYIDKVMLTYMTNLKEVGYYAAGCRIGMCLSLMGVSFGTLLFPTMSGYAKENNYSQIKNLLVKCERFIYLFVMPLTIFIAIYADVIIKVILGNEYFHSINVLSIVTAATFIALLIQPYKTLVHSTGFFKESTMFNFFYLIIFVMAEYLFVSSRHLNLGATGAAVALLVSNASFFIIFRIFAAKRIFQVKMPFNIPFVLYGIANLAFFYTAYKYIFIAGGKPASIIFPLVYFSTTYLSLSGFGMLKRHDFSMLKSLIDVKSMKDYTVSELFNDGVNPLR